jgi:hypothetical protein
MGQQGISHIILALLVLLLPLRIIIEVLLVTGVVLAVYPINTSTYKHP